jgi:hypothetical protein
VPAATASDNPEAGARAATAPTGAPATKPAAPPAIPKADDDTSDATFLRRLTLDVRGTPPTDVETFFFVSDTDEEKRAKVVELITDDDKQRIEIAKKLGVPVERVKVVRLKVVGDGKNVTEVVGVQIDTKGASADVTKWATVKAEPKADVLLFSADGKRAIFSPLDNQSVWRSAGVQLLTEDVKGGKQPQVVRVWDTADGKDVFKWVAQPPAGDPKLWATRLTETFVVAGDSDAEFLKRVLTDARGTAPTALELKYFAQDKDPNKREKLLDELLKEPAVQKKLGDEWKKKVLAGNPKAGLFQVFPGQPLSLDLAFPLVPGVTAPPVPPKPGQPNVLIVPKPPIPPAPSKPPVPPTVVPGVPLKVVVEGTALAPAAKFEKLVDDLIAAKKSDEAILEALTLAAQGRLPTDVEKALAGTVAKAPDRKAAWVAVAKALAAPKGDTIKLKAVVEPSKP